MDLSETFQAKVLAGQGSAFFDDLPNELVMGILSRLPVKIVVQSTCVCKRWYSIIKSPALVSAHLSHSISNPSNHYILVCSSTPSVALDVPTLHLVSDNKFLSHHANLILPFGTWFKSASYVASCHGLVCFTDWLNYGHDIYLVNPSIQKYRKLSAEFSCYADLFDEFGNFIEIGFGYSDRQNDYKVVRILYAGGHDGWTKAEVYSLKSGRWKIIDAHVDKILVTLVLADGCLYCKVPRSRTKSHYLQCFDLDEEVFRKLELPANCYEILRRGGNFSIFQKNGSLALYSLVDGNIGTDSCNSRTGYTLRLFVMGKDSSGHVQWKEKEFHYENKDHKVLLYIPDGFSSSGRLVSCESGPLTITAINLDDLSVVEKLWLDTDNHTFGAVEKLSLDSDADSDSESHGELSTDTDFIESLTLFLE